MSKEKNELKQQFLFILLNLHFLNLSNVTKHDGRAVEVGHAYPTIVEVIIPGGMVGHR
jgi:hypothetical protein